MASSSGSKSLGVHESGSTSDIVWWCDSRAEAADGLDALREFLWNERRLRLKPTAHIGRSTQGLAYCGFRVRPGVILASRRKLARYRCGLMRVQRARAAGLVDAAQVQRACDGLLATLAGAETLGFRRRLLHAQGDGEAADRYARAPGGRSA